MELMNEIDDEGMRALQRQRIAHVPIHKLELFQARGWVPVPIQNYRTGDLVPVKWGLDQRD